MNDMSYPLTSVTWDDEEITSLQEVIASGQFTMGEHVGQFEEEFATFIGSRYAIMKLRFIGQSGSGGRSILQKIWCFTARE